MKKAVKQSNSDLPKPKITTGKLVEVEFVTMTVKTRIGKKENSSTRIHSQFKLDTPATFPISRKGGKEIEKWGIGSDVRVLQYANGIIEVEKA